MGIWAYGLSAASLAGLEVGRDQRIKLLAALREMRPS